jgi:hypothetical protein
MQTYKRLLGATTLGLILAAGLAAPAFAQKLDNKTGSPSTLTTSAGEIDFGDDSSEWANDGECDDPRFSGKGSADQLVDDDILKDATDCKAAFDAGTVTFNGASASTAPADIDTSEIDFGDDSSDWANDGECDDPRFKGTGSAEELLDDDIRKDATDCRAAFAAGTVTLVDATGAPAGTADIPATAANVDFGDDTSEWANDGECDDPRFTGTGSAAELVDADILKDATDCKAAYEAGTVTFKGGSASTATPVNIADIDFGDDTSEWAKDEECDDPRFSGPGAASEMLDADILKDATDCKAAYAAGTVTFDPDGTAATTANAAPTEFDYGSDTSKWANDGECDDPRFVGEGTNKKLLYDDLMADATDCKTLEADGKVQIRQVYQPSYAAGAPYDSSAIEFGDNSSSYANDDQCDDPRFEGPGAAITLLDSDLNHDADDCKAAFEAGTIVLKQTEAL